MRPGDVVRVKVKETGEKVTAMITEIDVNTDPINVTRGGMFGQPPDTMEVYVPGPRKTTIKLVVMES